MSEETLVLARSVANHQLKSCPCYGHLCGHCEEAKDLLAKCSVGCVKCDAGIPRKFETNWYEGKWVHHDGNGWKMTLCENQHE